MKAVLTLFSCLALINSIEIFGKLKMHDNLFEAIPFRASRKMFMIASATRPKSDASIYSKPVQPEGNFVYPVPLSPVQYQRREGGHDSNEPTYKPRQIPQTQTQVIWANGQNQIQMPTNQYNKLFSNANSDQFHTTGNLKNSDFQSRAIGFGKQLGSKLAEKAGTLGTISSQLFTNTMKVQTGVVNNAQNQYLNVYAAKKTSDLSAVASAKVKEVQDQEMNKINSNPQNTIGQVNQESGPMWTSSIGGKFKIML